jgi:hypothetical protein
LAVKRGHNTFAGAFNAGQSALTPYAADLQPLIHKLNEAAVAHNDAIPIILADIATWDAAVANDPPPIIDPPAPAPGNYPVWMKDEPLYKWITPPNAIMVQSLSDEYFTRIGLPRPSANANNTNFGVNRLGVAAWPTVGWGASRFGWHGVCVDTRGSKIIPGGGDATWPDNSYHALVLNTDVPVWQPEVIQSCHSLDFENSRTGGDDTNLDGSMRGGHTYFNEHLIERLNSIINFGTQQWWPRDAGGSANVFIADLLTRRHRTDHPYAPVPNWISDTNCWRGKDPVTEDVYSWGITLFAGSSLHVWRCATGLWEGVLGCPDITQGWASGSIDWTNRKILITGRDGSVTGRPFAFVVDMNTGQRTDIAFAGPYASAFDRGRIGGLCWNPDIGKHLAYHDDSGLVFTGEMQGTTLYCDLLNMTGLKPPGNEASNGSVMSGLQYLPELRSTALYLATNAPVRTFRTG